MHGEPMFPGMKLDYPYHLGQPGHEMVGSVHLAGDESLSLRPGQRVVVWRDSGPARPGAYAQYVTLPAENLLPISADLSAAEIAPLELAMCVQVSFDQIRQIGDLANRAVGITGLGPAGLIAVQIARAMGAERVIGYDPVETRRTLAESLGAHETRHPDDESGSGLFLDFGLDMTGIPAAIGFLSNHAKRAVAMFGVVREDIAFPAKRWYGGFALLGYGNHNLGAAKRALAWVKLGKLKLAPLVTHHMGLEEYTHGVELLESKEAVKVLFDPWPDIES
jgi:threonine dehydrogenase-like Zn-dependent dehydrogenase